MAESFVKLGPEDVEQALNDLAERKLDNTEFLQTLMQSKLFTLLDRPGGGAIAADKDDVKLLRIADEQGGGKMIALFTNAENARESRSQAPGFEHLGRVDVVWALLHVDDGLGVLINPGLPHTFRIPPEGAAHLRQTVEQAIEQ